MEWLGENWIWVVAIGAMGAMHLFGHRGGHGGSGSGGGCCGGGGHKHDKAAGGCGDKKTDHGKDLALKDASRD